MSGGGGWRRRATTLERGWCCNRLSEICILSYLDRCIMYMRVYIIMRSMALMRMCSDWSGNWFRAYVFLSAQRYFALYIYSICVSERSIWANAVGSVWLTEHTYYCVCCIRTPTHNRKMCECVREKSRSRKRQTGGRRMCTHSFPLRIDSNFNTNNLLHIKNIECLWFVRDYDDNGWLFMCNVYVRWMRVCVCVKFHALFTRVMSAHS